MVEEAHTERGFGSPVSAYPSSPSGAKEFWSFWSLWHDISKTTSLKIALATGMPYLSLQKTVGTVIFVMFVSGGEERLTSSLPPWRGSNWKYLSHWLILITFNWKTVGSYCLLLTCS